MNESSIFQSNSKATFLMGLFLGIAVCSTLGLILAFGFASKGSLALANSPTALAVAPQVPSNVPSDPEPQPPAGPVKPVDPAADHIFGSKDAKVTMIEYSDFECPFCKNFFATVQQVKKDYPKDVRIVYRHFPLSFHQNAAKEAEASECAAELGGNDAFWKYHDKIFTETTSNGTGFSLDRLVPAAKEIGLDEKKFKTCLDSGKHTAKVNQQMQEGSAAGVNGTPATFINGKLTSGAVPYASIKAAIDAELKK